jgi:hypothetical protein
LRDGFTGIDLNGGTDRCLRMAWPTRAHLGETRIDQGIVINPTDDTAPFLVGHVATMSPIARGWSWPLWAAKAGVRHNVAAILNRLREDKAPCGIDDAEMLAAHIRHLVGEASRVGLVVPDDFGPGAQTRLLDVARRANRFDPKRGWIGWLPFPVWRSVATVFSWATRIDAGKLTQLRGRRVTVVSMFDDRLTVAALEIDLERVGDRVFITPIRQTMGKSGPNNYTPKFAETELVERISDERVREQVKAISGERNLARKGALPIVFQREDGTWFENKRWPKVNEDFRDDLRERGQADIRFLKDQISDGDIVLIECPETDRGLRMISWSSWYAKKIMGFEGVAADEVIELLPEDAALGACEYVARISNRLPTYFDHIYKIEIAALNADGESHDFIALFPEETRVPGNEEFKRRLEGRFAIQPGSQTLSFHLWRQDDPDHVRRSKTDLDVSPSERLPITLEVTQRPVSGYATIEVLPKIDDALGARRIVLDWEKMDLDAKSRAEVIRELDRNLPKSFPNHLPTITHSVAWQNVDPRTAMRNYLLTPVRSSSFARATSDLRVAISRRVSSPGFYNVNIDHPVYLFDSNGDVPLNIPGDRNGDLVDLVTKVTTKITADIETLGGGRVWRSNAGMPQVMSDLFLAGCWMYAGAPEACLAYMRDVFRGSADIGRRVESIGRVVSSDDDVRAALKWALDRLRHKLKANPKKPQIARELKAVSTIIQYRENSYRFLESRDANDLVGFALRNLSAQLNAKDTHGRPKDLKFSFLFSATVFLLVLRYRKKDSRFLEPPAKGEKGNPIFSEALAILKHSFETVKGDIRRNRRVVHRLAPEVIENAIEFLQKTGGNPDIIVAISKAEADGDDSEDDD